MPILDTFKILMIVTIIVTIDTCSYYNSYNCLIYNIKVRVRSSGNVTVITRNLPRNLR